MKKVVSAHKIFEKRGFSFKPSDYSKFKFGCKDAARVFGKQLSDEFIKRIPENLLNQYEQIVVISSPYCFIPTATFAMKDYFIRYFNEYLISIGCPVVEETKIHRSITYREDYGALSAEQRLSLIKGDTFHIDKEFVKDKLLIFLDDIRITGSHEKVIERMIEQYGLDNDCIFGYFATLENQEVDPTIENYLNYYCVKSLLDVDKIIKNDSFIFNTRVVKYILNYNHEECKVFCQYQSSKFLNNLYHLALGNSYHTIPEYQQNLNFIKSLIK